MLENELKVHYTNYKSKVWDFPGCSLNYIKNKMISIMYSNNIELMGLLARLLKPLNSHVEIISRKLFILITLVEVEA